MEALILDVDGTLDMDDTDERRSFAPARRSPSALTRIICPPRLGPPRSPNPPAGLCCWLFLIGAARTIGEYLLTFGLAGLTAPGA